MPKLKSLTGEDVIKIFPQFGFQFCFPGNYVELRRVLADGKKQIITILGH